MIADKYAFVFLRFIQARNWLNLCSFIIFCFSYFFPCQRWLATDEDDGQIARVLVPADKSLMRKLSEKDSKSVRKEIALETKGKYITKKPQEFDEDRFE